MSFLLLFLPSSYATVNTWDKKDIIQSRRTLKGFEIFLNKKTILIFL